jgi:hypothetical protein
MENKKGTSEERKERREKRELQKAKVSVLKRSYLAGPYGTVENFVENYDDFQVKAMGKVLNSLLELLDFEEVNEEAIPELADNLVSIWNDDLADWLKYKNSSTYVEDAIKEGLTEGKDNIFDILKAGQLLEYEELFYAVYRAITH